MDWIPAISSTGALALVLWLARNAIAVRLTNSVKHEYDVKIEELKAALKKNEKFFDAEIKARESQIEVLRSGALSGLSYRQVELYKKKLFAVEQLWETVVSLSPGKVVTATMCSIKYDVALSEVKQDQKLRNFFVSIGGGFDIKMLNALPAHRVRPYVSKLAWALFSAYSAIISTAAMRLFTLQNGIDKDFINKESIIKLIRITLPHQEKFINEFGFDAIYHLLDELEESILTEISSILQDQVADENSVRRAADILKLVDNVSV